MRRSSLSFLLALATLLGACSDDGLCGNDAGEAYVEVDASALASSDSQLRVCINDLCNADDSATAMVSVSYGSGEHPSFARWGVERITGGNWESLTGGEVGFGCSNDTTSIRIVVDSEGDAEVFRNVQLPGL